MSKDILYFPHDTNARNDKNIQKLLMKEGTSGLGIYWSLIEILHENNGKIAFDECDGIAFALHTECECIKRVIRNYSLFNFNEMEFWSERANRNLSDIYEKSKYASRAAKARWNKDKNADGMRTHSDGIADGMPESKVKYSKETIHVRSEDFKKRIVEYAKDKLTKYPIELQKEFYEYWGEHNPDGKKMRFEMEAVFDIGRRLGTWYKNNKGKYVEGNEQLMLKASEMR